MHSGSEHQATPKRGAEKERGRRAEEAAAARWRKQAAR